MERYTLGGCARAFVPGVVGGDVVRWHLAGREAGGRVRVAATIVAERVTGVVALVILSVLAVLVAVPAFATAPVFILLGSISTVLVGGIVLVLDRRLAAGVVALAGRVGGLPVWIGRGVVCRRLFERAWPLRGKPECFPAQADGSMPEGLRTCSLPMNK